MTAQAAIPAIRETGPGDSNHMTVKDDSKTWFSHRMEENLDALYGVALRLTRKNADAEDLVAESVAKAWSALDTLTDRSRFRPWIFRILRNRFISDFRKQSIRPTECRYDEQSADDGTGDIASLLSEQPDEFLNWWANPEHACFNSMLGDEIMSAIEQLPQAFRMTVLLINVEGLTYDEAAEVLGVPTGTVRSRMKRGRTLLQKSLWQQAREAGLASAPGGETNSNGKAND
jgi:RNA polymerase sigma-70 factor (ECF subfamily)